MIGVLDSRWTGIEPWGHSGGYRSLLFFPLISSFFNQNKRKHAPPSPSMGPSLDLPLRHCISIVFLGNTNLRAG